MPPPVEAKVRVKHAEKVLSVANIREANSESEEENPDEAVEVVEERVSRWKAEGNAQYYNKKFPSAIRFYNKCIKHARTVNYQIYNNRGLAFVKSNKLSKAIEDFTFVINAGLSSALDSKQKVPADLICAAYINRGDVYRGSKKQLDKAILDYSMALNHSNSAVALNNRGLCYHYTGELRKGIADMTKALTITPGNATIYSNRGDIYRELREYVSAVDDHTQAIKLNPHYLEARNSRAFEYNALGYYAKAIQDANDCMVINPRFCNAYSQRATAHLLMGDLTNADLVRQSYRVQLPALFIVCYACMQRHKTVCSGFISLL